MSKMSNIALPAVLLLAVLTISACATKPKEVAAEPAAPVAAVTESRPEPVPAPSVVAEQPAPVAAAEQVVPRHAAVKAKKKRTKTRGAHPKVAAPEPVAAPAPASEVQQAAPVVSAPTPAPVEVSPLPVQKAEPGFLEKYWLWLLGIVIVVIAALVLRKKD